MNKIGGVVYLLVRGENGTLILQHLSGKELMQITNYNGTPEDDRRAIKALMRRLQDAVAGGHLYEAARLVVLMDAFFPNAGYPQEDIDLVQAIIVMTGIEDKVRQYRAEWPAKSDFYAVRGGKKFIK